MQDFSSRVVIWGVEGSMSTHVIGAPLSSSVQAARLCGDRFVFGDGEAVREKTVATK